MGIVFYEDKNGNSEVENFINELNVKARTNKNAKIALKRIYYYLDILKNIGTRGGEQYTKHIEGDIWELRPGEYRIMFFIHDNYVLLTHFRKETQKTPKREIEKAKKFMNDWLDRNL